MEYIQLTPENLEREHTSCAISSDKDPHVAAVEPVHCRRKSGEETQAVRDLVREKAALPVRCKVFGL